MRSMTVKQIAVILFFNISIGLWRKNDKSKRWDTIGIGTKDYYRYDVI